MIYKPNSICYTKEESESKFIELLKEIEIYQPLAMKILK
jgi:hypothetical protein